MKKTFKALFLSLLVIVVGCKSADNDTKKFISDDTIKQTIEEVKKERNNKTLSSRAKRRISWTST